MQILTSIELKNFGIHKQWIRVEFIPTSNVIIGDNDAGKSTFFKGLYLVAHNKPSNAHRKFAYNKQKDFFVAVETRKDGTNYRIERTRNRYKIYESDKLIHNLTKFGQNVPEPVQQILPLREINWEKQVPKVHYLIFETGGTANAKLVKAFGLEDQKKIQDDNKEQLNKCRTAFKLQIALKKQAQETIEKLEPILEFEKRLNVIHKYQITIESMNKRLKDISFLIDALESIKYVHPLTMESFRGRMERIEKMNFDQRQLTKKHDQLDKIIDVLEEMKPLHQDIIKEIKSRIENATFTQETLNNLKSYYKTLNETVELMIEYGNNEIVARMKKIKDDYKKLLNEIGICPVCGKIINEESHENH
jgi:DNA repair exonuclease SbcCD ATPase subunit